KYFPRRPALTCLPVRPTMQFFSLTTLVLLLAITVTSNAVKVLRAGGKDVPVNTIRPDDFGKPNTEGKLEPGKYVSLRTYPDSISLIHLLTLEVACLSTL